MADNSFDVVSKSTSRRSRNAVAQAEKEIATRYDLKRVRPPSSSSRARRSSLESARRVHARPGARGAEDEAGQARRPPEVAALRQDRAGERRPGAPEDRPSSRAFRSRPRRRWWPRSSSRKLKVQASIQGDTVRVSGKNRDDLQTVIAVLRALDLDVPLTFTNYRSMTRGRAVGRALALALGAGLVSLAALPWTSPHDEGEPVRFQGSVTDATGRPLADVEVALEAGRNAFACAPHASAERELARVTTAHRRARRVHPRVALGRRPTAASSWWPRCRLAAAGREATRRSWRGSTWPHRIEQGSPVVAALTVEDGRRARAPARPSSPRS